MLGEEQLTRGSALVGVGEVVEDLASRKPTSFIGRASTTVITGLFLSQQIININQSLNLKTMLHVPITF